MAELSMGESEFEEELQDTILKIYNLKEDYSFLILNTQKILNSSVLSGDSEPNYFFEIFIQISNVVENRLDELINATTELLTISEKFNININETILNKEKSEIIKNFDGFFILFRSFKGISSRIEINFKEYIEKNVLSEKTKLKTSIETLIKSATKIMNELSIFSSEMISIINNYNKNVINISERFHFEINKSFQKRFNDEKNIVVSDFKNQIKKITDDFELRQKELKNTFNEFNINYTTIKKELAQTFENNKLLRNEIAHYKDILTKITNKERDKIQDHIASVSNDLISDFKIKFQDMDAEFYNAKKSKEDFVQLVQNAGIYNLTENYKTKSDEEKKEYLKLRNYTSYALYAAIAFTVVILGIPIVEYWGINPPVDTNYYTILARLTISLMFFVLALYFSRQAAKHYECYQDNHKTFLQLAALEPFMAKMDAADQLEIRKQLIPIYFSQDSERRFASNGDEVDISSNMHSLLSQALSIVGDKKEQKADENKDDPK